MTRLIPLVALLMFAAPAHADPSWRHGTRGSVTAYELDGRTVIDRKLCSSRYRSSTVEYGSCTSRLRDEVKARLCTRHGRGTHHFFFQVGDGRPYRSSVSCFRRG